MTLESRRDLGAILDEVLAPLRARERFVVGQLGQSLDGRIATEGGDSHYINGPEDRVRLHELRALCDAVVIGSGTAASDDPRLTVREVAGENPVRVVLDPRARLDPGLRLFNDGDAATLWLQAERPPSEPPPGDRSRAEEAGSGRVGAVHEGGATVSGARHEIVRLPCDETRGFDPHAVIDLLASRGLSRVLVEGGGVTVSRFLAAGALHRLHLVVAPLLIGSGRPALTLAPIRSLAEALRPEARRFPLGRDVLFDLELVGRG